MDPQADEEKKKNQTVPQEFHLTLKSVTNYIVLQILKTVAINLGILRSPDQ